MYLNSAVPCPGCKSKNELVRFRAPSALSATIVKFTCVGCESIILIRFTKPKGEKDRTKLDSVVKIAASPLLVAMLKEEAEFNAQPVEATL